MFDRTACAVVRREASDLGPDLNGIADAAGTVRMFEEHNLYEVAEGIKTNVRGRNFIDVEIVLKPPEQREMTANQVIELWRDSIGDLPGVDQVTFEAESGPGGFRKDISVALSHGDIDVLEKASQAFVERMEQFSNTRDVNDNYNKGKIQIDFRLRPEGRALGLTDAWVRQQLRGAFFGSLALRLMRGTNETEVRVKLPKEQRQDYPGITWSFEGSNAEMRQATASLRGWFSMALVVIYALLAIAFRSYVQPFIVLLAIPFGIVGAVLGHMLLGYDLSLISLMGVIALAGVVVNDSLIMIDCANRYRGDQSAHEAILQSGVRRFRPILLTTATTFGGLIPIIFEKSLQAQYIIPMAISLGFGTVFATAITLVLVPCVYLIQEDVWTRSSPPRAKAVDV